jgi:hypothetical protein
MKNRLNSVYRAYGIDYQEFLPRVRLAYLRAKELSIICIVLCVLGAMGHAQASCPGPTPGAPHVCLKWTASTTPGATYNIYRATTSGAENYGTPLNSSPISGTSFYDSTVAVGTTYFYTAVSVGTGGVLSQPSAEVSAQIPVPPSAPTALTPSID